MKIKEIRAVLVDISPKPKTKPRVPKVANVGFVRPTARYPQAAARGPKSWKRVACIVTAQDGTWGFGMSNHGRPVASTVNDELAPLLEGENCMATEKLWDMMFRTTAHHGSSGLASYAISAVDVALWDLKGKLLKRPVYELLGGPQKDRVFCYASNTILDYGLQNSLEWFLELGFRAVKVFLTHGPVDGQEGFAKNVARVAQAREIVGEHVELAVDCWMSLDVEYTVRLIEALKPYRIKWLEDYLLPGDMAGYAKVRNRLPEHGLASGEHWYTPQPFAVAASRGLVDILQPDVLWAGGLSSVVRICHIAEAAGLTVINHAGMNYPFGQHLAFAMPVVAWGERSEGVSPPGVPLEEMVALPGTAVIKDGWLVPNAAPGFGLELTIDWLENAAC